MITFYTKQNRFQKLSQALHFHQTKLFLQNINNADALQTFQKQTTLSNYFRLMHLIYLFPKTEQVFQNQQQLGNL